MEKHPTMSVSNVRNSRFSVRQLAVIGLLTGVTIMLGMTGWGFIPIPPINATILHVPTILGAILEGPKVGLAVGFLFGAYSMAQSFLAPNVLSFAFMNPLISVVPRMLIGLVAFLVFAKLPIKNLAIRSGLAAFLGSWTNTILVMFGIYAIYGKEFAAMKQIAESDVIAIIVGVVVSHGFPEAILATVIAIPLVAALSKRKS